MADGAFWAFVEANIGMKADRLRLKYHKATDMGFDVGLAITQIECRKRFGKKLAETLEKYPHWLFPTELSGEQSTSDLLARYHAMLISEGERVIDLTAGLGIDAWHLSTRASRVTACEIDQLKAQALQYNAEIGKISNLQTVNGDCREYIRQAEACDTIFIDPARRSDDGGRVYALVDCKPDVVEMLPDIRRVAKRLIVKASPMLDITQTLRELPHTSLIIAIGSPTECKELVAVVDFGHAATPVIKAVTLRGDGSVCEYAYTDGENAREEAISSMAMPKEGDILYEPYPTVMKTAPFKLLASQFGVKKLHNNTHLYFSAEKVDDFPGQAMEIVEILPFSSKHIKGLKKIYPKISVTTRNFSMTADKLRSKLGVNDGGDHRLVATTLADGSQAMIIAK